MQKFFGRNGYAREGRFALLRRRPERPDAMALCGLCASGRMPGARSKGPRRYQCPQRAAAKVPFAVRSVNILRTDGRWHDAVKGRLPRRRVISATL